MPLLSTILIVVLSGTDSARGYRKVSFYPKAHSPRRVVATQRSDPPSATNRDSAVVVANDSKVAPSHVDRGRENDTGLLELRHVAGSSAVSDLLEHLSLLTRNAKSKDVGSEHFLPIMGFLLILLVFVLCVCSRGPTRKSKGKREVEQKHYDQEDSDEEENQEVIKRLTQSLPIRKVDLSAGNPCETAAKQRHLGIWWGTHSHTWASTRLGWWESKQTYERRSQAMDNFFLKDISDVRLTDSADGDGEPGVCIVHEGQDEQADSLQIFFATEQLASQYAKDIKSLVRKVKQADAAERGRKTKKGVHAR